MDLKYEHNGNIKENTQGTKKKKTIKRELTETGDRFNVKNEGEEKPGNFYFCPPFFELQIITFSN